MLSLVRNWIMVLKFIAIPCTIMVHNVCVCVCVRGGGGSFLLGCRFHNPPVTLKRGVNYGSQAVVSGPEMWNWYHVYYFNHTLKYLETFIPVNAAVDKSTSLTHYNTFKTWMCNCASGHYLFLSQMRHIPTTRIQQNLEKKKSSEKNVFMSSPYFNFSRD